MDTLKTANFIRELRQKQGMTQKELADQLGVSDKTVSKWENARGLPDISSIEALCKVFDITINELLCGEKLSPESYEVKAEENIKLLMNSKDENRKAKIILTVLGVVLVILSIVSNILAISGTGHLFHNLLHIPSLIFIVIIELGIVLISRPKSKTQIIYLIHKSVIHSSVLCMILGFFSIFTIGISVDALLANMSIALLPVVYGIIIYIFTLPFLKEKYNE